MSRYFVRTQKQNRAYSVLFTRCVLLLSWLTMYLHVPILINTSSLVIFFVHDIGYSVGLLCEIHKLKESNLDSITFVNVHLSVPLNSVSQTLHFLVFSSVLMLVNVVRVIIVILLISSSDIPSSVIKLLLPRSIE